MKEKETLTGRYFVCHRNGNETVTVTPKDVKDACRAQGLRPEPTKEVTAACVAFALEREGHAFENIIGVFLVKRLEN